MTKQDNGNSRITKYRVGELEKWFKSLEAKIVEKIEKHCEQVSNFERTALGKMQEMTNSINETRKEIEVAKKEIEDLKPRVKTLEQWRTRSTVVVGIIVGAPAAILIVLNIIKIIKSGF